jgi:hypothetical protein
VEVAFAVVLSMFFSYFIIACLLILYIYIYFTCFFSQRDEFVATLYELVRARDKIDYIIIETTGNFCDFFSCLYAHWLTGRADPAFVQVFMLDPNLKQFLYVDGIIALVDARSIICSFFLDIISLSLIY